MRRERDSGVRDGKRRLEELRRLRREGVHAHINRSRPLVITNIVITIASGLLLAAGLSFVVRFMLMERPDMDPAQFRIGMGALAVFTVGWFVYLALRVRHYLDLLERRPPGVRHTGVDGDEIPDDAGGPVR